LSERQKTLPAGHLPFPEGISPLMQATHARGPSDAGGPVFPIESRSLEEAGFEEYKSIVGFNRWADVENRYQLKNRPQFE